MTAILLCLLIMLALQLVTPAWWWIMIVPFAFGATARSARKALRTGFFAAGLLWLGTSLVLHISGSGLIAKRMAGMFGLGSSWLLVLATGLVAAIAAAVSGYAGYAVQLLFKRK